MSGTDETELNRIREAYGDLMNEEDRVHFPTAQEQAKRRVEERRGKEKRQERATFIRGLFYDIQSVQRVNLYFAIFLCMVMQFESVGMSIDFLFYLCTIAVVVFRRIRKFDAQSSRNSYICLTAITCLWFFYAMYKGGYNLIFVFMLAFLVPLCVVFLIGTYLGNDDKPMNNSDNGAIAILKQQKILIKNIWANRKSFFDNAMVRFVFIVLSGSYSLILFFMIFSKIKISYDFIVFFVIAVAFSFVFFQIDSFKKNVFDGSVIWTYEIIYKRFPGTMITMMVCFVVLGERSFSNMLLPLFICAFSFSVFEHYNGVLFKEFYSMEINEK